MIDIHVVDLQQENVNEERKKEAEIGQEDPLPLVSLIGEPYAGPPVTDGPNAADTLPKESTAVDPLAEESDEEVVLDQTQEETNMVRQNFA